MSRVRLVRDKVRERGRKHRQIDVDRDATREIAEVVVETAPGLVFHELELHGLTIRKPEESLRPCSEILCERRNDPRKYLRIDGVGLAPGDEPLCERTVPRHDEFQPLVRSEDLLFGYSMWPHAVTRLDFIGVLDPLAAQNSRRGQQPDRLGSQPTSALRLLAR